MSRYYDNWDRLLKVVFRREDDRRLAYASSSSYSSTTESDYENISLNGTFRRVIVDGQEGELSGRGSFGSVREVIDDGQTSLPIEGSYRQSESICESPGFSGIDDFGIPVAEYEAMKVRSSAASSLIRRKIEDNDGNVREISSGSGSILNLASQKTNIIVISSPSCNKVDEFHQKIECNGAKDSGFSNCEGVSSFSIINRGDDDGLRELSNRRESSARISTLLFSDNLSAKLGETHRNGIKGVRPAVLVPPPSISLPKIDNECSTWHLIGSFAPDNDKCYSRFDREFGSEDDDQETHVVGGKRDEDEDNENFMSKKRIMMGGENGVLFASCSFTTSNDDDSWSTSPEPASSYGSPDGRSRHVIVDWQKGDVLGHGSFASVYEGITDCGFFFAVKEVSLLDQGDEGKQRIIQLEQEIALLSQFEHENIVQYYGTEKDESHLYIFLQLVSKGSLLSLYQTYNLKDSVFSAYTRQILHGLKYLHDKNVIHRDIRCANILVDVDGSVKLADFGLAKATKLNDVKSFKRTPFWMAPEVVRSLGYGLAADIWSLGCTVLEMLTQQFPYSNMEPMRALFRIGRGELPPIPETLSSDARDFILKCLQVDASARPEASQLLDHPFVKQPLSTPSGSTSHLYGQLRNS